MTGFLGLINGSEIFQRILWLHNIGGCATILVLGWIAAIILDVFGRIRRINLQRFAFLLVLALLLSILSTGFSWQITGYAAFFGLSLMTIHALSPVVLGLLLTWHALTRQFVFHSPKALDRRAFLRFVSFSLARAAFWQLSEVAQAALGLAGARRQFTGSYPKSSYTGEFPTVTWLFDYPAPVQRETW